jgi:hypothetical protein
VEQSVVLEDATEWFARLVREAGQVVDRQRVIAESLLTERCLAEKSAHREAFMQRLAEHADDKRVRYETPARLSPATQTQSAPEAATAPPEARVADAWVDEDRDAEPHRGHRQARSLGDRPKPEAFH